MPSGKLEYKILACSIHSEMIYVTADLPRKGKGHHNQRPSWMNAHLPKGKDTSKLGW